MVRVYEAHGGRACVRAGADGFAAGRAVLTDPLERPLADAEPPREVEGGVVPALRPFQMVTPPLPRA
ncbi:hypothetical protein [Streptomyces sp. NPDC127595]|uniref:hypothetical protein n=1 Tax=Streptomyces sp. NPDC127595 TaxID=3345405 RepID=UPI00363BECFE